jgi:hypothetical protein
MKCSIQRKATAMPKLGLEQTSKLFIFNRIEGEQISRRSPVRQLLADLSRCGGFEPTQHKTDPSRADPLNSTQEGNPGCPISRVFCEKWGLFFSSITTHPKTPKPR